MSDKAINIILEGSSGSDGNPFVEVQTDDGTGIRVGRFTKRDDGYWGFRLTLDDFNHSGTDTPTMKEFDLNNEEWREYDIPGWDDLPYKIKNPQKLFISDSATTHRILDDKGIMHCIPFPSPGTTLRWKPKDPNNPCDF